MFDPEMLRALLICFGTNDIFAMRVIIERLGSDMRALIPSQPLSLGKS